MVRGAVTAAEDPGSGIRQERGMDGTTREGYVLQGMGSGELTKGVDANGN